MVVGGGGGGGGVVLRDWKINDNFCPEQNPIKSHWQRLLRRNPLVHTDDKVDVGM